ncbi:pilus assembly protein [Allohahella marinimesophila]|uniref:Type 4a pilus biogenesis protein PilY1 n=1 Tax=Allohahella marinimesophila TaxID=1054972 RepID=A0ABP7NNU7_9GAMM
MLNETLKIVISSARKSGAYGLASLLLLGPATQTYAAPLNLATVPLFVKNSVEPNIFVTLDDSGSMAFAYTPDDRVNGYETSNERLCRPDGCSKKNWLFIQRKFASPDWNLQFYNPDINYVAPKKADGSSYATSFTNAYVNGFRPDVNSDGTADTTNLSNNYFPTFVYTPSTSKGRDYSYSLSTEIILHPRDDFGAGGDERPDTAGLGQHAYYYRYDPSKCTTDVISDNDCYRYVKVGSESGKTAAESRQNFANWFSFYRTRVFAAASAASLAFEAVGDTARLAFQALNKCNGFNNDCEGWTGTDVDSRLRPFNGAHRDGFYNWLSIAPASGGTPLRSAVVRAGAELTRTGKNSAYAFQPGTTETPLIECRPSYHMLFTDGLWNGSLATDYGNVDNTAQTMPPVSPASEFGAQNYTPIGPFKDSASNTVADIVFSQWYNDAQPDMADKVPVYLTAKSGTQAEIFWNPKNDSAHWQHMTTFTVGLGFSAVLNDPDFNGDTFGGDYSALVSGAKTWPSASNNSGNNPYDLWHAAINGRGKFFSADDPNTLVEAFRAVLQGIQDRTATAAAPASDSAVVEGADFAYAANFNSENWSGDLRAFALTADENGTLKVAETPSWSAGAQLASRTPHSREIKIANTAGVLVDFEYANLTAAQQAQLSLNSLGEADAFGADRVTWLRGSDAMEDIRFRSRGQGASRKVLGDIVYSAPLYVGAPSSLNLDKTEGFSRTDPNSYEVFKTLQAERRPMVYVGANDGMLHAFDANTGVEIFAFVPSEIVPKLNKLTAIGYKHEPFVDGELNSFDVYDPASSTKWRTILIGSLRAGGRSVYALDVTDPDEVKLMWEISGTKALNSTVRPNLGHVYGKAQIGRLHNGKWGVVIGNGYKSDGDRSQLLVLNALTGETIKAFDTGVGTPTDPNGMAEPLLADVNGDLIVDSVYAGDLHGKLWRFDLINTAVSTKEAIMGTSTVHPRTNGTALANWKLAENKPLFTAMAPNGDRQSITTRPQLALHPFGDSYLVTFGTGKYIEEDDGELDLVQVNSFYSVWDRSVLDKTKVNGTFDRDDLQQQKLLVFEEQEYVADVEGEPIILKNTIKRLTTETVEWLTYDDTPPYDAPVVNERGWFLDFVEYADDGTGKATAADPINRGEMMMTNPIVRGTGGEPVVFFMSSTPLLSLCESGLENYIFGLSAAGGPPKVRQFDLNNDGMINNGDYNADDAAYGSGNNLAAVKIANTGGFNILGQNIVRTTANGVEITKTEFGANDGRQTWRQLR